MIVAIQTIEQECSQDIAKEGGGKAFPQRFVCFLCLQKDAKSSHFCLHHLNPLGELRLSTRSQCNLFIFKLFGSMRVYPYLSIPSSRTVPSRLRRQQTFLPFSFCERTAELQSLLQENAHTFFLVRSENNDGCRSIPDLQIRGRSTLNQLILFVPPGLSCRSGHLWTAPSAEFRRPAERIPSQPFVR